jgi:hypothetical protein
MEQLSESDNILVEKEDTNETLSEDINESLEEIKLFYKNFADAIHEGNLDFITQNKDKIKEEYIYDTGKIYLTNSIIGTLLENTKDCIILKHLIEIKAFDPNLIINDTLLIIICLYDFKYLCETDYYIKFLEIILCAMDPQLIKNYRDKRFGLSILIYLSMIPSYYLSDKNYNLLFNLIIKSGADITEKILCHKYDEFDKEKGIEVRERTRSSYLYFTAYNLRSEHVLLALNAGADPNQHIIDDYYNLNNLPMILFRKYRYTKNIKKIETIIQIVDMFINSGLDIYYKNVDGYNLMDFVNNYGWNNIKMKYLKSINTECCTYADYLYSKGFSDGELIKDDIINDYYTVDIESGDGYESISIPMGIDLITNPVILLAQHDLEKDPDNIIKIINNFEEMEANGENFKIDLVPDVRAIMETPGVYYYPFTVWQWLISAHWWDDCDIIMNWVEKACKTENHIDIEYDDTGIGFLPKHIINERLLILQL